MPQALPYIVAAAQIYAAFRPQPKVELPPPPPTLTMEEARQQAEAILNPLYNEQLPDTLRRVQLANMQRGFFGQAPGAELSQRAAADIESRRAQNIAQLASQLQGMTWEQAAQHAQLALQNARAAQASDPLVRAAQAINVLQGVQALWPTWWSQAFNQPITNPLDQAWNVLRQGWIHITPAGPQTTTTAPQATVTTPSVPVGVGGTSAWINPY